MNAVKDVQQIFRAAHLTLGSVESFTGGLFASKITAVPGASKFYKGGLITYFTEEKQRLLDIPIEIIKQYGVVSKEVVELMAKRGLAILNVDCCVAFTGNAGPEALEDKRVGRVYIGIAFLNKIKVLNYELSGTRQDIQQQSVALALNALAKINKEN
ncbi:MAG: CinA family protein [Erysipelotrichia bacterium]|nr:CinA family protein [Erysipelotrichia bacterium]